MPQTDFILPLLLQLDKCRKLIQTAEKSLKEEKNYYYGIEACNEVLHGYGDEIGPMLTYECLCIRAALLLKVSVESLLFMLSIGFVC